MGRYCLVPDCKNKAGNGVTIHTVPKCPKEAQVWMAAVKRDEKVNTKNCGVCSNHFTQEDYERDIKYELMNPGREPSMNSRKKLKMGAIPSKNIPSKCSEG